MAPTAAPASAPTPAPTGAALSEEAAQAAAVVVEEVGQQEGGLLRSLFENVSEVAVSNASSVASVEATSVTTKVGVTAAAVVDAVAVASSGASAVEISADDSARSQVVRVVVPASVISQAASGHASGGGGTAVGIAVTVLADAFPETRSASAQVSVVVVDNDGNELSGVQLAEPVEIVLLSQKSEGLVCAWWNSPATSWSTSGVEEVVHDGPQFVCRTHHLSIFTALASFATTLEKALVCSNSKVVSAESFRQATSDTTWVYTLDGFVYVFLIVVTIILMMSSFYLDSRWKRRYLWTDTSFCTTNESLKTEKKGFLEMAKAAYKEQLDISRISRTVTYHALAHEEKVAVQSIQNLLKGRLEVDQDGTTNTTGGVAAVLREAGDRMDEAVDSAVDIANQAVVAVGQLVERNSKKTLERMGLAKVDVAKEVPELLSVKAVSLCDTFWSSRRRWQVWVIFVSVNRWIQWYHYSIFDRSTTRGVLLLGQVWGAIAVIALFSEQTGSSLSQGSDAECEVNSVWERVQMDVAVGFWSAIMSSVPIAISQAVLLRRRFVYQSEWEVTQRMSYSRWWKLQEMLLLLFVGLYTTACILFVGLFLGSVTPMSRKHMTASSICSVCTKVVAVPLGISIALLAVATVHQRLQPGTLEKIKEDIRTRFEMEERRRGPMPMLDEVCPLGPPEKECCQEPEEEPKKRSLALVEPAEPEAEDAVFCPAPHLEPAPVLPGPALRPEPAPALLGAVPGAVHDSDDGLDEDHMTTWASSSGCRTSTRATATSAARSGAPCRRWASAPPASAGCAWACARAPPAARSRCSTAPWPRSSR
ncbi:unnamed protein product [Prorocentrum cordatum]|uniref:GAIN-B domain-containing protein n=1 Tax=Prorocentrum cordatum TaxID=2364126 RepID=A0ABN9WNM0_9DINO|nr:unnamed protein product [Polarella glacialis]